jgi:tRNA/tmRNA/rRNA uracil-C5-methylase (TrmA/RlmC/RlmD family)
VLSVVPDQLHSSVSSAVTIERIAHGGYGVAHDVAGRVVFVRHAFPGELVSIRSIATPHERYSFADTVNVLRPSPDRVPAACPVADRCGGCDFQQLRLEAQRRLKLEVIREQLDRAGVGYPDFEVESLPGDTAGLRWRTRMDYQVGDNGVGLYAYHTRDVVPLPPQGCLLAADGGPTPDELAELATPGVGSIRVAVGSDATSILVDGTPVRGPKRLTQWVTYRDNHGIERRRGYQVAAAGFWQVHPGAPGVFATAVLAGLDPKPGEIALDLYCGSGLFSGALASCGVRVTGIDSAETAVSAARRNVPEAVFRRERVERASLDGSVDLVVLDPSRAGAKRAVVQAVAGLRPRGVAYVACDPAALARDLAYFAGFGYQVSSIRAFDAFPMTHHVETIVTLIPGRK